MPKVRLTPTDDPQVFVLEEIAKPTLGDDILERLETVEHKAQETDAILGRILMRLVALEKQRAAD